MARKPDTGAAKGAAKARNATPPQAEPEPAEPERRLATAATHISYDWRGYDKGEQLAVTRPVFEQLARSRSVAERTWDDCARLAEVPAQAS